MSKKILITGGSGGVGKNLSNTLLRKGYEVVHLSRSEGKNPKIKTFLWDIDKDTIDENCINGVDTIVHLAGEGIANERWTEDRKNRIIKSRTDSIKLVYNVLKVKPNSVKNVISASATGYYSDRGNEFLTEESSPANDFLGQCCVLWEKAVDEGLSLGSRVLKFRTGVILDKETGALPKISQPIKLGIGSPLGSGDQWIPWIHLQDVINMYLTGIENEQMQGVFNMCAPNPVTNKQLTKAVAKQLKKPLWLPNVPAFALKMLLGEMSTIVLGSTKVNAAKITNSGFKFAYPDIETALKDIYG